MDELGLGADSLRAEFPRLVYCSLWAFGRTGPRSLQPGYEPMVQAFSSLMWLSGDEDDPPTRMGTSVLDFGTGMWAAMGVLAALEQRHRTGQGCVVDTSLFETALSWLTGHFASFRLSGELPTRHRTGSRRLVIFQGFETKNGPVVVAAGNDRLFAKLAEVLGHPEWAVDLRFSTNPERVKHREVLVPLIETIMLTRTKGEWVDLLESVGVPCAPVNTLHEVLADPQTEAIGMIQKSPEHGLELMSLPISFDGARPPLRRRAPTVGEHNAEILPRARAMRRAHLLRWRPRPPCHVTRETIGPTNFRLRGPDMAPHSPYASRPRVACHRGPHRSWTLLIALAGISPTDSRRGAWTSR